MKERSYTTLHSGPKVIVQVRMSNGTYLRGASKPTIVVTRFGLLILRFAMLLDSKLFKDTEL